ncbi:FimV/HubP family polar landmark protein [Cohnella sp. REN36]|uniref:FimV/HubP family polar landmark protein n=1 Tax=Cohnella sp. REN36 TaxID=2887347 RepID=UPI001D1519F3|nr:FimV/HubP family polar landmark protein [Cohnella sp. REN36]MCC3375810.1 O-antigen ligase family protein [Cohnella sp. REN36]
MRKSWDEATAAAGGIAFAGALAWAAYAKGLFFEGESLYRWEAGLIALAAVCALVVGLRSRMRPPLWAAAPFGLVLAYALPLLGEPASVKGTADALLRWGMLGAWTVLAGLFLAKPIRRHAGMAAFHASGLFVVLGGLAGWYGWLPFPDIVFRSGDAALAATGARLAGFLQYPNAFAAVAGMLALAQWQLLESRGRLTSAFAAAALIPTVTALLLTESRGAMLAVAAGGAISWAFRPRERRGFALAAAGIAIGLASAAASASFAAMERGSPAAGCGWLLAAAAVGGAALWLLRPRTEEATPKWAAALASIWGGSALFALGLAAAYLLLIGGGSGGARVASGHLETASARQLYYADALRMFAERPLLGAGGETWRMQAGLYQSQPYIGNEVHSGYLEVLIDTGLVGFALLMLMLICYAVKTRRSAASAWGPAAVLLAHAAVDFDWAYAFVWMLLLYWLALHLAEREKGPASAMAGDAAADPPHGAVDEPAADAPGEATTAGNSEAQAPRTEAAPRAGLGRLAVSALPALLLLGLAAATVPSAWRYADAARADVMAAAARSDAVRIAAWREALEANPAWSLVRLRLGALLAPQERTGLLAQGLRYEPRSAALHFDLGMAFVDLGETAAAEKHLREAIRLNRFNRDAQDAVIARLMRLSERFDNDGDAGSAKSAAEATAGFFERYRDLYARQYAGRPNPWYETGLFASAKVNAAKAYRRMGMPNEAEKLLREVIEEDREGWRDEAETLLKEMGLPQS